MPFPTQFLIPNISLLDPNAKFNLSCVQPFRYFTFLMGGDGRRISTFFQNKRLVKYNILLYSQKVLKYQTIEMVNFFFGLHNTFFNYATRLIQCNISTLHTLIGGSLSTSVRISFPFHHGHIFYYFI